VFTSEEVDEIKKIVRNELLTLEFEIYTPIEVAKILSLSEKTVKDFLRADKIKGFKLGKEWRVKKQDLQDFIDNCPRTKSEPNRKF
jgi:excisionase family DNA binding protein